ncbi:hypothetical protein JB92DRAFT_2988721 [Gautieria morchelliformis]|nr:hypothetical protein JB92DRAFT_2988721 [Gautieria morchelliformis]
MPRPRCILLGRSTPYVTAASLRSSSPQAPTCMLHRCTSSVMMQYCGGEQNYKDRRRTFKFTTQSALHQCGVMCAWAQCEPWSGN